MERKRPAVEKVSVAGALAGIGEHWAPRVVGELNGQEVKLVKLRGEFTWHSHSAADELFFVLDGEMRLDLRDGAVDLRPGEFAIVPRGVEHRPVAEREAQVLLFEPAGTVRTGDGDGAEASTVVR